jgi:hypothetical protein
MDHLKRFAGSRLYPFALIVSAVALCAAVAFTSDAAQFAYFVLGMLACFGVAVAGAAIERDDRGDERRRP